MITSNVAFYPCISIVETERFYKDLIGLETVLEGDKMRIFSANKGHFGFVEYGDSEVYTGRLCLSLNCQSNEEVDQEYDRILAQGGKPLDKPCKHPVFPVYSFFIKDPNGYTVEFQKLVDITI